MRFWRQCIVADTVAPPIREPYNQFEASAVTFFELASLLASAATIFGLIVGAFSVWNGRMTRREIGSLIAREEQATRDLIATESHANRDLITTETQATREIIERIATESRATRDLIATESGATRDLIATESQATRELMEAHQQAAQQILSRLTDILGRIDDRVR